jgi:hypothetical protein
VDLPTLLNFLNNKGRIGLLACSLHLDEVDAGLQQLSRIVTFLFGVRRIYPITTFKRVPVASGRDEIAVVLGKENIVPHGTKKVRLNNDTSVDKSADTPVRSAKESDWKEVVRKNRKRDRG